MESIKLTEEHKKKLLEMCKALFPKYEWGFGEFPTSEVGADYIGLDYLDVTHINHKIPNMVSGYKLNPPKTGEDTYKQFQDGFVSNINNGSNFFSLKEGKVVSANGYSEGYIEGIHWFEFCMTHLMLKLDLPYIIMGDIIMGINNDNESDCYKIHLIDYLYEEFKKLK